MKQQIADGFRGKLKQGTIRRIAKTTVDAAGDDIPGAVSTFTFEGIRETFDARYRAVAGIPEKDVKVLVILGLTKPDMVPKQEDQVFIENRWHAVRAILSIDPANASASLQCYEIPAPV